MNLSVSKECIFVATALILASVLLGILLPKNILLYLFIFSTIIHVLVSLYFVYSEYELNFLHERQGSKLTLSKDKLISKT